MENKYQEGKIYKIVCNITGEIYYGSTIKTLEERLRLHKQNKNCVSRNIINRGDYKIELIKDYPCDSKYELVEEESKYIRENKCINFIIPHRTQKQYIEDNKEKIAQQMKEYNEKHKKEIQDCKKKWKENNKEEIKQQMKKYYEDNKEELKEYSKDYYEKNKKEISKKRKEKIKCECGALVSSCNLTKHKKTFKHIKLMECLII